MKESVFKFNTPVLIICFNRPQYIQLQLAALRQIKPPVIYISRDGARQGNLDDNEKTKQVKDLYLAGIDWDCTLSTRFLDENLGCFDGPRSAMQWFFEHEKEGIIVEDDIIPGIDFFRFAQDMLEKYRNNEKIISISGCNFGYQGNTNEYFFCKIMNMWGWATWKERFEKVDFTLSHWKNSKFKRFVVIKLFYKDLLKGNIEYLKKWYYIWNKTVHPNPISWWDYQFIYNQLINRQFCVYPGRNLIQNIGFTGDSTHTKNKNHFMKEVKIEEIVFPLKHLNKIKNNRHFEQEFLIKKWFWQ